MKLLFSVFLRKPNEQEASIISIHEKYFGRHSSYEKKSTYYADRAGPNIK